MTAPEPTSGTTGVDFVDCDLIGGAPVAAPGRRREVVVSGRRVRTVNIHAHCAIPEAMELMSRKADRPGLLRTQMAERIQAMDEQGIDIEALSINPYWYGAEVELAREIIRIQNEKLAEICSNAPDRFVAFATVALQHPELAAEQLEEGVRKYGLRGASLGGSVDGLELADPRFHPFWKKAEEMGILVFIHPQGTAELASRLTGSGGLDNAIGNPLETTIALSHLIFEGTLDRFPGLKICAAHGGGYLPSYAARSDAITRTFPARVTTPLARKPTEYIRDLYYDSIVFTSEAMRHLIAETSADHIMIGTDYPYPWTTTAVDHVLETPGLSDDERIAILGGTAARLLGLREV